MLERNKETKIANSERETEAPLLLPEPENLMQLYSLYGKLLLVFHNTPFIFIFKNLLLFGNMERFCALKTA